MQRAFQSHSPQGKGDGYQRLSEVRRIQYALRDPRMERKNGMYRSRYLPLMDRILSAVAVL